MSDFFQPDAIPLRTLRFVSKGARYHGSGHLLWDPASGARLLANVTSSDSPPSPEGWTSNGFRVISKAELASVKADSPGFDWILIPHAMHADELASGDFPIDEPVASYVTRRRYAPVPGLVDGLKEWWTGHGLYRMTPGTWLPHTIKVSTTLGEKPLRTAVLHSGIDVAGDDIQVSGITEDREFLELYWQLDTSKRTHADAWNIALAIELALRLLLGQRVRLLSRTVERLRRDHVASYEERRRMQPVWTFGELALVSGSPDAELFGKCFIPLIRLFLRPDSDIEATVAKNIVSRTAAAAESPDEQIRELTTAITLEAALRTLYDLPNTARIDWDGLKARFSNRYWSNDWAEAWKRAEQCRKRLRQRNAHPNWIRSSGGAQLREAVTQSYNDRIFLSRFYGYMVLGLAGIEDLQPDLLPPVEE